MSDQTRPSPEETFPENLRNPRMADLGVLNSRVHRQMDAGVSQDGLVRPETEGRNEALRMELDERDGRLNPKHPPAAGQSELRKYAGES